ncbi:MAG: siderophore-interacting protein [Actinomycetota bacterium]|nr:siderophore-interacting protein [Actinomycetota bacterium]
MSIVRINAITVPDQGGPELRRRRPAGGRSMTTGPGDPLAAVAQVAIDHLNSDHAEAVQVARLRTFVTTVVRRRELNDRLLQLTFGGGDLVEFEPVAADQFVYVLAPPAGRRELSIDQHFTWTHYEAMPVADRPRGAYYSVRHWRPAVAEMDVIVVRHDGGEASGWAEQVTVGEPVAVWGPREVYAPPADTGSLLLVADETGLPALAAILEHRPAHLQAVAVIEIDDESHAIPLAVSPADRVVWLRRGDVAPGTTSLLLDAVRSVEVPADVYAWGGAETKAMTAIRRYLRDDVGLPQERVAMTGYWRLQPHDV